MKCGGDIIAIYSSSGEKGGTIKVIGFYNKEALINQ